MHELTFAKLREVNIRRCVKSFHPLNDWGPAEWSNAMAGEVGEVCNFTKKALRGDLIPVGDIGKEIADVVVYADLLSARLGLELGELVRNKFNEVSVRVRSDERL